MRGAYEFKLRELRTKSGLSQQKLADALGVTRRQIQAWECGDSEMSISYVPTVCSFFGVTMDELAGFTPIGSDFEEGRLIRAFRALDPEQQKTVIAMVEGLSK